MAAWGDEQSPRLSLCQICCLQTLSWAPWGMGELGCRIQHRKAPSGWKTQTQPSVLLEGETRSQ